MSNKFHIDEIFREVAEKHEEAYHPDNWAEMQSFMANKGIAVDGGSSNFFQGVARNILGKTAQYFSKGFIIATTALLLPASQQIDVHSSNSPELQAASVTVMPTIEESQAEQEPNVVELNIGEENMPSVQEEKREAVEETTAEENQTNKVKALSENHKQNKAVVKAETPKTKQNLQKKPTLKPQNSAHSILFSGLFL